MPDFFFSRTPPPGTHLIVYPIGGASQSQFAQRYQITFAKEMLDCTLCLTGDIDLAFVQALTQIVRWEIDQYHIVSGIEKWVRNGFAHLNTGDAADHIIQAFQMLDVNGSKNVNASFQQLFNVLPALRMP